MRRDKDILTDQKLQSYVDISNLNSFFLLAGAGSGKTRSLVTTLQYILKEYGEKLKFEGKKVAVVTYTKSASEEINRRLDYDNLFQIATIHSFSWELIRHFQRDIKKNLLQGDNQKLIRLNDEIAARRSTGKEPTQKQSKDLDKLNEKIIKWKKIKKFSYSPDSNSFKEGSLNHSQVIEILSSFLKNKIFFRKLFVNKYPIVFIDECQDTNKALIDALLITEKEQRNFCLGLFGDMMQQIYLDGKANLKEAVAGWENHPEKEMNWRSQKRIVEFINEIRKSEDGLTQYNDKEKTEGVLKVYIRSNSVEKIGEVEAEIKERFKNEITIEDKEINSLILEHRMAANRNGFIRLYDALDSIPTKEALADASGKELNFLRKIIFRLYDIYLSEDSLDLLKLIREERLLGDKKLDWEILNTLSKKLKEFLILFANIESMPMKKYISELEKLDLFEIPEVFIIKDEESKKWFNWDKALQCTYREFEKYFQYKDNVDGFVTQQGSKGLEYNNVMIIISDDEKRGTLFSFEKLFGIDKLTETDRNNIRENKDNSVSRTKRLFYVAASRAKESLALIIYTKDVGKVKSFFIDNSLATDDEIDYSEEPVSPIDSLEEP